MGLLSTVFLRSFSGELKWKGSVGSMKVFKRKWMILKQKMVTTMEDYKNEFRKIWFYQRNDRRKYCI